VGQSAPSNEVTVGPPPYGFNQVVAAPSGIEHASYFGVGLSMTLDGNGDPALAYVIHDPIRTAISATARSTSSNGIGQRTAGTRP